MKTQQKKERNCADRMRKTMMERQRKKGGGDPALTVMIQLLAIVSIIAKAMPSFSFSPRPPAFVSSPPGPLPRHLDDEDRGPTAHMMERGIEPNFYRTSSRAAPSWSQLVKDLKRDRRKGRALELLEYRVPPAAVLWLRDRVQNEDFATLLQMRRNCGDESEVAMAALKEAKRWRKETAEKVEPESIDPGSNAGPTSRRT
jgi:hypothetical protein